jgi:hypothetical protein
MLNDNMEAVRNLYLGFNVNLDQLCASDCPLATFGMRPLVTRASKLVVNFLLIIQAHLFT